MKKIIFSCCLLAFSVLLFSCQKSCEKYLVLFSLSVSDSTGAPVVLDKHYTLDVSSMDTLFITNPVTQPYCGFGDSSKTCYTYFKDDVDLTTREGKTFRFEGLVDGRVVVKENYFLKHDGCHVDQVGGATELTAHL